MTTLEGWCYIGTYKRDRWVDAKLNIQSLPREGRSYPAASNILLKPSAPNPPLFTPPPENLGVIPAGASVEILSLRCDVAGNRIWARVRATVQ
jgi:hypothetical protein